MNGTWHCVVPLHRTGPSLVTGVLLWLVRGSGTVCRLRCVIWTAFTASESSWRCICLVAAVAHSDCFWALQILLLTLAVKASAITYCSVYAPCLDTLDLFLWYWSTVLCVLFYCFYFNVFVAGWSVIHDDYIGLSHTYKERLYSSSKSL